MLRTFGQSVGVVKQCPAPRLDHPHHVLHHHPDRHILVTVNCEQVPPKHLEIGQGLTKIEYDADIHILVSLRLYEMDIFHTLSI